MSNAVVVQWPGEQHLRRTLSAAGVPLLLVIDPEFEPPLPLGPLEDWVGHDAGPREVELRMANLAVRGGAATPDGPRLEEGDIVRYRGRWAALSPSEVPIARRLLDDFDRCVPLSELGGDATDSAARATFYTQVRRIRMRIEPLGLAIETVRGHGLVLSDATGGAS